MILVDEEKFEQLLDGEFRSDMRQHLMDLLIQSKNEAIRHETVVMPKIADVMKLIEVKAKSYNDNKKEDRIRKGVYVDCLVMLKDAIRESNFPA